MTQTELFTQALDFARKQCEAIITGNVFGKNPSSGRMNIYTVDGKWGKAGETWTSWCEGFYPGILWLLHQHTGHPFWRMHAETATRTVSIRRHDRNVHDLGFLLFSTALRWYHLDGDAECRQVLIDGGRTLAMRRQIGGYLCSFLGPDSLFIDIMMNVGLILWAARETNDETLRQIALEHCRTTQRYLVRPDGGTAHEGIFDVTRGTFVRESTQQGHAPNSTWSRGLAWAIYGFAAVHRLSGEPEFLATAQRCAECYLRRAPANLIPPWDFDAPEESRRLLDSSAAAITASGLFDLAELMQDDSVKQRYRTAALSILETLCSDQFLAHKTPGWEGILLHGVYHLHKNLGVDESVAWGDHFFVEALVKALH